MKKIAFACLIISLSLINLHSRIEKKSQVSLPNDAYLTTTPTITLEDDSSSSEEVISHKEISPEEEEIQNISTQAEADRNKEFEEHRNEENYYNYELSILLDKETLQLLSKPVEEQALKKEYENSFPVYKNEYVEQQLKHLLNRKAFIQKALSRAEPYINEMKEIFREEGIPEELVYLPLIESGFHNHSISRVGAVGMWQFMPKTAIWVGMRINDWLDERRDPIIACRYAAKFMKFLYDKFGDWYIVLASYNHGGFNVRKELAKVNSKDFYDLVRTKVSPKETRDYVPRFVASVMIIKNAERYGLDYKEEDHDYAYYHVPLITPIHLVAKHAGISVAEISALNAGLRAGFTPDPKMGYKVRLPKENCEKLISNYDALSKDSSLTYIPYYVKRGDSLSVIADNYGISVSMIMNVNGLRNANMLSIGQKIFIPMRQYRAEQYNVAQTKPVVNTNTVQQKVVVQNQTTVNRSAVSSRPSDGVTKYVIKNGDTISQIALKFGVNSDSLIRLNGLAYPYLIRVGDVLRIKTQ